MIYLFENFIAFVLSTISLDVFVYPVIDGIMKQWQYRWTIAWAEWSHRIQAFDWTKNTMFLTLIGQLNVRWFLFWSILFPAGNSS